MFVKSNRLLGVVLLSALGIAKTGYSQTDDIGFSASSNSFSKGTPTSMMTAKLNNPNKILGKSAADSAWDALPKYKMWTNSDSKIQNGSDTRETLKNSAVYHENFCREYFEKGFGFWRDFPDDQRKYKWLRSAVLGYAPRFWKNVEEGVRESMKQEFYSAPVDRVALENWKADIKKYLISYLNERKIGKAEKNILIIEYLNNVFDAAYNYSYWESDYLFLAKVKEAFEDAHEFIGDDPDASERLVVTIDKLFLGSSNYGITVEKLREFVMEYREDKNPAISNWVTKKLRILNSNLSDIPLFNDPVFGGQLDIEKFRGKVVLLDYWNIYCSTCITRMAVVKPLYEKYRDSGFEVISVSIDPKTRKERAEKIQREVAGNWTHILIGGKDEAEFNSQEAPWKKIWNMYGFNTVPQMMLYDRQGKLVMVNGELVFGDPEMIIKSTVEK